MKGKPRILAVIGPTASGKSSRAVDEALARDGEIISVDSRQVYRGLDIGTEKTAAADMRGVPHHLIDIREPEETYSAGNFVADAARLIEDIGASGKLPILAGGTHFYFDALIRGLPGGTPPDPAFRAKVEGLTDEEIYREVRKRDAERALQLDQKNRRRLVRALEILTFRKTVPPRATESPYDIEWIVIDPSKEELYPRIEKRLKEALARGLIDEVRQVRERVGDIRLNELGLEYRVIGEYLRGERAEESLFPALTAKLWQYARSQKKWLRKLKTT